MDNFFMWEERKNPVREKSYSFARRIVKLYCFLTEKKREFVLSKQLLRSGTSIGANIRESSEAQSKPDFISKMSIALKEVAETDYWIHLLQDGNFITQEEAKSLLGDNNELARIITAIIRTSKKSSNR